ncbi:MULTISPECIES: hypothetical protein [unclassified Acinetobacter]|uniref:hypothetical protein n=1 Tax=unclassified Acinetobacter TaxID=196816 RepID=UPI0015D1EF99|nr:MULTISPECIES: hypothetical protein [unclassified Acinetobacter]UUS62506.1 hypothetical protein MST17_16770 [Acinetobacter sp. YH16056_T]
MIKKISILFLSGFLLVGCGEKTEGNGYILIKNNSDQPVTDVAVNYSSAKKTDVLGTLYPKSSYNYVIFIKNEDSIKVSYKTADSKVHSKTVVGYLSTLEKAKETLEIN